MVDGVVLLHGLARTRASMRATERALARNGYRTLNLGYHSRRQSLARSAEEVHAPIVALAAEVDGRVHFVTHSMGGLLARVYLATKRPPRLGRVVMLGPPHHGSAIADLLQRNLAFRSAFGPAGQQLTTEHAMHLQETCGPPDYDVGIIAGTRSINLLTSALVLREPNDGKVTVRSTRLDGAHDHIALPVSHPFMMNHRAAIRSTLLFLREGRFR